MGLSGSSATRHCGSDGEHLRFAPADAARDAAELNSWSADTSITFPWPADISIVPAHVEVWTADMGVAPEVWPADMGVAPADMEVWPVVILAHLEV